MHQCVLGRERRWSHDSTSPSPPFFLSTDVFSFRSSMPRPVTFPKEEKMSSLLTILDFSEEKFLVVLSFPYLGARGGFFLGFSPLPPAPRFESDRPLKTRRDVRTFYSPEDPRAERTRLQRYSGATVAGCSRGDSA